MTVWCGGCQKFYDVEYVKGTDYVACPNEDCGQKNKVDISGRCDSCGMPIDSYGHEIDPVSGGHWCARKK